MIAPRDKDLLDAIDGLLEQDRKQARQCQHVTAEWMRYAMRCKRQARRWKRNWLWTFGALQVALAWIIWRPVVDWLIGR